MTTTNQYGTTPAGTITKEDTLRSIRRISVAGTANIVKGYVCTLDTLGFLVPADANATDGIGTPAHAAEFFVALESVDNTSGTDAAVTCPVAVRGHFVTVTTSDALHPGDKVVTSNTIGQVRRFVPGTDAGIASRIVGVYWGKESGIVTKNDATPYLEAFTDTADFPPADAAASDVVEIQLGVT